MKKIILIVLIMSIASFVFCWSSVGFKIEDHDLIKEYQLPAWGYSITSFDLTGYGEFDRRDTDNKLVYNDFMIRFLPDYLRYYESEKFKYALDTNLSSIFKYHAYENKEQLTNYIDRNYQVNPGLEGVFDYYIKDNLFVNLSLNSKYLYYENNDSQDSSDLIFRAIYSTSTLGIGFGKIRDVSPVFSALRLRERIEALNRGMTLSENQIKELADKFALYPQYANIYDRYEKYFWKEISPILGNDFDALSLSENLYLTEIMKEYGKRYQGHEMILGFDFWQNYYIDSEGDKNKYFSLGPILSYKFYNNLNLKYQIGIFSKISYFKYLTDDSAENSKFIFDFTNSHLFDITDRIRLDSSIGLGYNYIWYDNIDGYTIKTTFNTVIDYFIENNFSLYCQLKSELMHVDKDFYENNAYDYYYSDLKREEFASIYFGCRYYFGSMF